MKFILYILVCSKAVHYGSSLTDPFTRVKLLPELSNYLEDDKISNTYFNFSNNQNNNFNLRDLSDVYLIADEPISSQFIVSSKFKINSMTKQWCLFSIRKEGFVVMSVCFLPVSADSTDIILHVGNNAAEKSVSANIPNNMIDEWIDINIQLLKKEINFRLNCKCINLIELDDVWPEITLTEDMDLILAKSSASLQIYIQEITLYPNGNEDTMQTICDEVTCDGYDYPDEPNLGKLDSDGGPDKKDECTCTDEMFTSFLTKNSNLKGDKGERGIQGDKGLQGDVGLKGEKGEKGEKGVKGSQGPAGSDGADGIPGINGNPGKSGVKGAKGDTGPPGPRYVLTEEEKKESIIRIPGLKGERGPIGPSGDKGEPGKKGETGNLGPRGPPGDLGPGGIKGIQGEKGQKGETGIDGKPGASGDTGKLGDKGEKGHRGSPGIAGAPAKLSSILKEEIPTEEKERIIKLLRGDKGDKGSTGEKGTPGNDGKEGAVGKTGDKGEKGEIGTKGNIGSKGDRGKPGPAGTVPASEIALLKGPKGDVGLTGLTGPAGSRGDKGEKGDIGPKGLKGDTGLPGIIGKMGPVGPPGLNGTVGEKGQKGESAPAIDLRKLKGGKGDIGLTGTGRPGRRGPAGTPGRKGDQGSPGLQGYKGEPGLKGEVGQPGVAVIGEKGEKGDSCSKSYNSILADINDEDASYPANTFVYVSIKGLKKASHLLSIGTIVYVIQEKILLIKSKHHEWSLIETIPISDLASVSPKYSSVKPEPIQPTATVPNFSILTTTSTRRPYLYNNSTSSKRRRKNIRLIALNEPYAGTGIYNKNREDADRLCHEQSALLQRKGYFMAFRSNKLQFLRGLVPKEYWDLPVVNVLEQPLFDSWRSIFNGSGAVIRKGSNILSFNYHNVLHSDDIWKEKIIWHGSTWAGKRNENCQDWSNDSRNNYGTGSSLTNNLLLGQEFITCDKKLILLCVEVETTN